MWVRFVVTERDRTHPGRGGLRATTGVMAVSPGALKGEGADGGVTRHRTVCGRNDNECSSCLQDQTET